MNILTLGINIRDLACSVNRAGHNPYSINFFNSIDIHRCSRKAHCMLNNDIITTAPLSEGREAWNTFQIEKAMELLEKVDIDMILPHVNTEILEPLGKRARILGNDLERLGLLRDKLSLHLLASKKGIQTPETRSLDEAHELGGINYPCILKPRRGSRGIGVELVNGKEDIIIAFDRNPENWLLQEYIKGTSYNINFLSNGSEVIPLFLSRQLFQLENPFIYTGNIGPIGMAGAEEFIDQVARFIKRFSLKGILGADFIVDDKGVFWLIEVNPRIQGSYEVVEDSLDINMFNALNSAWNNELQDMPAPKNCAGKMIVTAEEDYLAGDLGTVPGIRDIPHEKAFIKQGEPICTVTAKGRSPEDVRAILIEGEETVHSVNRRWKLDSPNRHQTSLG